MKIEFLTSEKQLEAEDAGFLVDSVKEIATDSLEEILAAVASGAVHMWRFTSDDGSRGIMFTKFRTLANQSVELVIVGMAGSGFKLRHIEYIMETLEHFARRVGATEITAYTKPEIARVLERRHKFTKGNVHVSREI